METETFYLEVKLYPDNDEVWYSGKWDSESSAISFDVTAEQLIVIEELRKNIECDHEWVDAVIEYVGEENSYVSEFWGDEGIYVDEVELDNESWEPFYCEENNETFGGIE
jgi:hypothetical protein